MDMDYVGQTFDIEDYADFDRYLTNVELISEAEYNNLSNEAKNDIELRRLEGWRKILDLNLPDKADTAAEEDAQRAAEEARRAREAEYLESWKRTFDAKLFADKPKEREQASRDYRQYALSAAREKAKKGQGSLLQEEVYALQRSLQYESRERVVPLGIGFAEKYQYLHERADDYEDLDNAIEDLNEQFSGVDAKIEIHMLHMVLKNRKFDLAKIRSTDSDAAMREIYPARSGEGAFYREHMNDEKCFRDCRVRNNDERSIGDLAGHRDVETSGNVDFIMEEMFRLNKRMKRNSRGTQPLKELCEKLDELETDYRSLKDHFHTMGRGELKLYMDAIMLSADRYIQDKSKLTSFSSTQLERLKCMNQLKTLQESLPWAAEQVGNAYGSRITNHDFGGKSYLEYALAEKLVLAQNTMTGNGKAMCSRNEMKQAATELVRSSEFGAFMGKARDQVAKSGANPDDAKILDMMLKQNGQKLRKNYDSFVKEYSKRMSVEKQLELEDDGPILK